MNYKINGTYGTMYYVKDMGKATKFYKEVMGLAPRFESPEWTEFDVKGHGICLHIVDNHKQDSVQSPDKGVLILDVKGINEMRADMVKKGVEFLNEVKSVYPGAFCTDFKDPSGNVVGLYEDTNRK